MLITSFDNMDHIIIILYSCRSTSTFNRSIKQKIVSYICADPRCSYKEDVKGEKQYFFEGEGNLVAAPLSRGSMIAPEDCGKLRR